MRQMPSIKTVKTFTTCEASPIRQNPSDAKLEYARRTNTNSRILANFLRSHKASLGMLFILFQFRTLDQQAYCLLGSKLSLNRNRQRRVDKSRKFSFPAPAYIDSRFLNQQDIFICHSILPWPKYETAGRIRSQLHPKGFPGGPPCRGWAGRGFCSCSCSSCRTTFTKSPYWHGLTTRIWNTLYEAIASV